ncbi:glycosyltransferase [Runella aurantiaca]|uniref:Glycosyltransferase family 1 protein n=1 Tax=Runella aurantiaca TaxID=2282308 RepID=A0A369I3V7_9BACT|nr:glycosyltransferase [Runella aurantiaca]RDB03732.1 glycosyltransferase family 1 protein [Runella aurantiaca]
MIHIVQTFTMPMSLLFLEGQTYFWQQNSYKVHVLTSGSDELSRFGTLNNVSTSSISFCRAPFSIIKDLKSCFQLIHFFQKIKPLFAHGNTPKAALLTMITARITNIPIRIYEMHGLPLETANWRMKIVYFLAEKICCRLATHVIAVSPSLRKVVITKGLIVPSKISVMHNGSCNGIDAMLKFNPSFTNIQEVEALKTKYGIAPNQSVVGFVGRLTKEKGVIELYEAWQKVKQRFPTAMLLVIGSVDERVPLSNKWLDKLAADETIVCAGEVKNMASHYALMDFMVLPSHREGLGNVVLEAAAMKKPSIVSYVTGLKDAILKNHTGLFCQAHSADDLMLKIIYYLENKPTMEAHGIAARTWVIQHFCPVDVWEAKLQLYQRLVAEYESVIL